MILEENKPSAAEVLTRAGCLLAVGWRLTFDRSWQTSPHAERAAIEEYAAALDAWVDREGLRAWLARSERELFASLVGAWPEERSRDLWWRLEALVALTWSLGLLPELPGYDTQCEFEELHGIYGILQPMSGVAAAPRLRPTSELEAALERSEHWRLRTGSRKERRAARGVASSPVKALARSSEFLFGKPFALLSASEFQVVRSISLERCHAFRWLCGKTPWEQRRSVH